MALDRKLLPSELQDNDAMVVVFADVDNTLITTNTKRDDYVSQAFMDFTKELGASVIFLVTHRAAITLMQSTFELGYPTHDNIPKKILITSLKKIITKELDLKHEIIVITPDDIGLNSPTGLAQRCGFGYETLVGPIEQEFLAAKTLNQEIAKYLIKSCVQTILTKTAYRPIDSMPFNKLKHTKNYLIESGAAKLIKQFPHCKKFIIHFIDDCHGKYKDPDLCGEALKIHFKNLPGEVKEIHSHFHDAWSEQKDGYKIKYVGAIKRPYVSSQLFATSKESLWFSTEKIISDQYDPKRTNTNLAYKR